ncbi:AAA family ATPase [Ornithinibacillus halophilus]|uniref:Nuclease SbcCD subunit C n=1 Tax=Ornithinibacillus halophilus TaxID=930117 RepID=A0A1M5FPJ3_9BACI|nr:SMC family ATPase [Ornithinibacillus halophilus]SHF93406.1 exonuclease SbcC [Ornithinibacillus halophilus]
MKPLKLTMTAFGPYKHSEVVDFNELDENKLFVISGNTGAGKTTIFDGICFALYGSASGTDREDNKMLRSDFADDQTHTSVELEFELHGRTYRILRQLGHVKKGNKSKTGEKYEFYEKVDGKEIPCVDRQMVSEIDKKVEAIIGLTQDQFKQIVMLPQGEFRKLLTSQTENKEAILRRLFKTESYKQMNDLLKNKKNIVEQEFKQAEQTRKHYVQSIPQVLPEREDAKLFQVLQEEHYNINQVVEGLDLENQYYQVKIIEDNKIYEDAYQAHDKKQTQYHESKALNEKFDNLNIKEKQLEELQSKVPDFENKEKELEAAERASTITFYEEQAKERRKVEKDKQAQLSITTSTKNKAEESLEHAKKIYEEEEGKKELRENTTKKLDQLREFLPTVKEIDEKKRHLQELAIKGKQAREELDQVKEQVKLKNEQLEKDSKKISQMDEAVSNLSNKQQKLYDLRDRVNVLRDYLTLNEEKTNLTIEMTKTESSFLDLKSKYSQLEDKWLTNQASVLATHLHEGEACPVCGSMEHPNKATDSDEAVSKEVLDELKKQVDQKDSLFRDVKVKLNNVNTQLKEKVEQLEEYHIDLDKAKVIHDQLVEEGKKLKAEVNHLKHLQVNLKEEKEQEKSLKQEIKDFDQLKEKRETNYQNLRTKYQTDKAVYEERLRNIPEEVQVLETLEKEISETEKMKLKLEKAWEVAQRQLQEAKEELTKAESNVLHAQKQVGEAKENREKADTEFFTQLKEADFSTEESYHNAKLSKEDRTTLKETIERFKNSLSTVKQQVSELKIELKDKTRIELEELKQELLSLKETYEKAFNTYNRSKEYLQETMKIKENILTENEKVTSLEKKLATITDLYDVARGQNSQKISFERYLQIEYLERIIDAANQRLKRLSNGQYYLIRSDRQESHGRQSGLALDVYDAYTGQTRDVKSLSGGEKFNASLCLALGMSDVIQSFQGNISINTMFIDEGFGSLDEESLHKSIDALIDLQQSGRMIGVISHVQELKAMFPAILQVSKTKEGYSKTKFLVK